MDLQKGSLGFLVKMLQTDLLLLGYDLGTFGPNHDGVDGIFGPVTEAAVKAFQAAQGIAVSGIVDSETGDKLEAAITAVRQQLRDEANHKLIGTVSGQVQAGGLYFNLPAKTPNGDFVNVLWLCDTGCSPDMLVTAGTAAQLGLPNMGPTDVSGVGGSQASHRTQVTFELGGHKFMVPAIVDENVEFGINLFGAGWVAGAQMQENIDWHAGTLTLYAYVVPQTGELPPGASYTPPQEG